jgi:F-type H+-transporting ATPase subunit epsilon
VASFRLEIVSVERVNFEDDVNVLVVPGVEGQLAVLAHHAPLMTVIRPGEMIIRRTGAEDINWAIGGGFLEVRPDKVIVLADSCEQATEIDIERAQEAKRRAEESLTQKVSEGQAAQAQAALQRALVRLAVAEKIRHRSKPIR